MITFRSVIIIFLSLTALVPALAENHSPNSQYTDADKVMIVRFATYYFPVAKIFKCTKFSSANKMDNLLSLEYIPEGDDVNSWTRLMTVMLYPLPAEKTSQIQEMRRIILNDMHLGDSGKVLDEEFYQDSKGYPILYIEWTVGHGVQEEHEAGSFMISAPNTASMIMIQARGKPFDEADAARMRLLAKQSMLPGYWFP
jgi:hypothetical protein